MMAQGGYVVLAWFKPHEADKQAFAGRMRDEAAKVRSGGLARQFEFHAAADSGDEFMLYEEFASEADWQAHHDAPAIAELHGTIAPMIAEQTQSVWSQVAGFVKQDAAPGHSTRVLFRMESASVQPMVAEMTNDVASAGGMLRFDLNENADDPGAFLICARWADRAAWQAHQTDPDYLAFRERTAAFYATKPDRTLWRPLR